MHCLVIILIVLASSVAAAQVECVADWECESKYRSGSKCLETGECSNPFVEGCLRTLDPEAHERRHCNSDDKDATNCRLSPFQYPEIRINNQDWETAIIFSWILQICLMEFLDVPVTVGLGSDTAISSFYSTGSAVPYSSKSYAWDAIEKANELGGDCLATEQDCIHVIPDVWLGQRLKWEEEYRDGQIDYIDGNGQVGKISWYIPAFTAARHPFTVTHIGLALDRNRTASLFKRPTTWGDYCDLVSETNCSQPDGIAEAYPEAGDKGKYFADGYIGHFRPTIKNNCTGPENNATCTGHIVNGPCSWSTFLEAQAYYNGIALESDGPELINGGYAYGEMLQIWAAANATKSDVIMWWYEPDSLVEAYRGTDFEFTKIHLPSPSVECRESRTSPEDRCSADPLVRLGGVKGSCDNIPHTTKKAIASSLRDVSLSSEEVDRSPGYYYIRNFNVDELEISDILNEFVKRGRTGQAARDVVCNWVADNADYLKSFIPPSFPRELQYGNDYEENVTIVAQTLGGFAVVFILVSYVITCVKRNALIFVYAQVHFIFAILCGMLLVSVGSIIASLEPNNVNCIARVWLVCLGYTFELAPLIIKVSAMNSLMRASRRMRRVRIKTTALYAKVIFISFLVTIYLVVWTTVDPPRAIKVRTLSDDQTVITEGNSCSSESRYWQLTYNFWEGLLIVWAFVLAFQSRHAKAEFNESRSLGMMTYSHFVFAALRIAILFVFENDPYTRSMTTSFLLSLDVILALCIYLLPKMINSMQSDDDPRLYHVSRSVHKITERVALGHQRGSLEKVGKLIFGDANVSADSDRNSNSESEAREGSLPSAFESSHFTTITKDNPGHSDAAAAADDESDFPNNNRRRRGGHPPPKQMSNPSVTTCTYSSGSEDNILSTTTSSRSEKSRTNNRKRIVTFEGDINIDDQDDDQDDDDGSSNGGDDDDGDEDLRVKLLHREEEIRELKNVVRLLQRANRFQEERIQKSPPPPDV
eukprot:scaffold1004_cov105-Cylindrotheca_fusiformis.AAC.5